MLHLSAGLTAYLLILTAVLGMVMGSFTACMAGRMAAGEDWTRGRSRCDACGHVLGVRDLVPVFSWVFLKGKCRYCGAKISPRCPLTEILCGAAFLGVVLRWDVSAQAAQYFILTILLLAVALVDYDTGLIPDRLLLAIFLDFLLFVPVLSSADLGRAVGKGLLSGLAASAPLLILSLVMDRILKKESMGGGDLKLFFVCGLFFPLRDILFLLITACILGLIFAVTTRKTTGDPENPRAFPFGPAIAAAAYLSLLIAEPAVTAYLNLFQI